MRRLFLVVSSSSDVQHLHRLSSTPIVAERRVAAWEVRCEKLHQRAISDLQTFVILYRHLPERPILRCFRNTGLQCTLFHSCASSWILYKTEDGDTSPDHRVNFC